MQFNYEYSLNFITRYNKLIYLSMLFANYAKFSDKGVEVCICPFLFYFYKTLKAAFGMNAALLIDDCNLSFCLTTVQASSASCLAAALFAPVHIQCSTVRLH